MGLFRRRHVSAGAREGWVAASARIVEAGRTRSGRGHRVRLRVEPEGGAPFEVEGSLTVGLVLARGMEVRVQYDPRRPARWELDEQASWATVDFRDAVRAGGIDLEASLRAGGSTPAEARALADQVRGGPSPDDPDRADPDRPKT